MERNEIKKMNIDKFFPEGTKRRQVIRGIARIIKGFRISNLKKIYKSIKSRGIKQTLKSIYTVLFTNYKATPSVNISDIATNVPSSNPYQEWIRLNEPN